MCSSVSFYFITHFYVFVCVCVCVSAPEHPSVAINEVALILLGTLSFFALQIFKLWPYAFNKTKFTYQKKYLSSFLFSLMCMQKQ
jgi:hypothetical protein